ncbi:MAG: hypothetical protein COV66_07015, partial [Nitrospinae bacterium CG11_big_fil_rev_8_21_14_0_20_45_15]
MKHLNLLKKKTLFISFMALLIVGFFTNMASAEVFLKGNYVEVGIHNSASFGTSGSAPAGYHPRACCRLGFVADYGRDGWGVGTPAYSGDFFVPGSPEEGWAVEWTTTSEKNFGNFGLSGSFQVPVSSLTKTSSGATEQAVWQGTASSGPDQLQITKTITLNQNDLYFVINVVMTNVGSTTLNSLEYMRNVDPDQGQPWGYGYSTYNFVQFQPPRPASGPRVNLAARPAGNLDKALSIAIAKRSGYNDLTLGLGTIDPRAVVAASHGFANRDTDSILNNPNQPASLNYADAAIVLAYDLGSLAPGQSTSIDYAYILDAGDLTSALGSLAAVTILQPTGTVSGTGIIFQATTDDIPNTTKIDFYVNGVFVGTDTSPDAGGVFQTTFDSRPLANGPVTLKAIARFSSGQSIEKTSNVTVDNAGPPMSFSTPANGTAFSGTGIPIGINILDSGNPPVTVSFFRESASSGSTALGTDSSAPFTSSFGVTDLADGETVVIKAVGRNAFGRTTTITLSGSVVLNQAPTADAGPNQTVEQQGPPGSSVTLNGTGSSDPDGDPLTYSWIGPFGTASGATPTVLIPAGVHTIQLTVSDGLVSSPLDTTTVTVRDTTAPVLTVPADITTEATGPATLVHTGFATATDVVSGSLPTTNDSPGTFPVGTTVVTHSATDGAGNTSTGTQNVTVTDTTPPVVTAPANITQEATAALSPIPLGTASAVDLVDGPLTPTPDNVGPFPGGTTTITWSVTDANGNTGTATQTVTVTDTTPPVLTVPADVTVEATSAATAVAIGTATAIDAVDGAVTPTNDAPATFPVGTTVVNYSVTDAAGNTSTGTQNVTVTDTTAPVITAPADVTTEATGPQTAVAIGSATATDAVGVVSISSDAPANYTASTTTVVTWTACDAA